MPAALHDGVAPGVGGSRERRARWSYAAAAGVVAIVLILCSQRLAFRDFGDFSRVVDFMVRMAPEAAGRVWPFRAEGIGPMPKTSFASFVFGALGRLQSLWSDHFSLAFSALVAKVVLVLAADRIAAAFASRAFAGAWRARFVAFVAICLTMFAAHNAGMLWSFYGEYCFFLGLPWLLLGCLDPRSTRGRIALCAGALFCGLAKVQYFYVPLLALLCVAVADWQQQRSEQRPVRPPRLPSRGTVAALLAAQLLCLVPLGHNPYAKLNHHQATYFGSYLMLSEDQLRALGLDDRRIACVGIDGWGHKAMGPGGAEPQHVGGSCYGSETLSTRDVLAPYLAHPWVLPKLMAFALPQHFTMQYFHVYRYFRFLAPASGVAYGAGEPLVWLTELRERTVTRAGVPLLLLAFALAALRLPWRPRGLRAATLLLSLLVVSQIVISLLGEGIRDLSKHLWGAQLALDFLVLALAAHAALWLRARRHAAGAAPA